MQTGSNGKCTILSFCNLPSNYPHLVFPPIPSILGNTMEFLLSSPLLSVTATQRGTRTETHGSAVPWCIHLSVSNASTGYSAPPTQHQRTAISNVAPTSGSWSDHKSNIALLSPHHLRRLTHSWLKLLGFVLTWRYCRHEGALCYRPLDLEEATAVTCNTVVQNGTQGTYRISFCICRLSFVTTGPLAVPSVCVTPFRLFIPCCSLFSLRVLAITGKRGSDPRVAHAQICVACYTRQAPLCLSCL